MATAGQLHIADTKVSLDCCALRPVGRSNRLVIVSGILLPSGGNSISVLEENPWSGKELDFRAVPSASPLYSQSNVEAKRRAHEE